MTLSARSKLGLDKETNWGVYDATSFILFPYTSLTLNAVFEQVLDEAKRGIPAKDFGAYQGVGHIEGSIEGPVYPEEIGHIINTILGTDVVISGTPTTHHMTIATTPSQLTLLDDDGVRKMAFLGMRCNNLAIKFSGAEGLLTHTSGLIGKSIYQNNTGSIIEPTENISADATSAPLIGWTGQVFINPSRLVATQGTGGSLADGTYYFRIAACSDASGTTPLLLGSQEVQLTIAGGGGTAKADLSWDPISGANSYRIYKGTLPFGQDKYFVTTGTSYSYTTDTGATPASLPLFNKVLTVDLAIARENKLVYSIANSQFASGIHAGPLEFTAKLSILYDNARDFDRAHDWGNTQHGLDIALARGTGPNRKLIAITVPTASWGDGNFERDRGDVYMTGSWNIRGIYNFSDARLMKIILLNSYTSAY